MSNAGFTRNEAMAMTRHTARIGWVVDAQNDFLLPPEQGGRLYVRDLFDDGGDAGAQLLTNWLGTLD